MTLYDPAPLFVEQHLQALMGIDEPPLLADFYAVYLQQTATLAAELRAAAPAPDLQAIEKLAHKFKSSTHFIGALALAEQLDQIETACRNGVQAGLDTILQATAQLADTTMAAIARYREQLLTQA